MASYFFLTILARIFDEKNPRMHTGLARGAILPLVCYGERSRKTNTDELGVNIAKFDFILAKSYLVLLTS